jgi:hypothetical protein
MKHKPSKGLFIAGLINILGVLFLSKGFQDLSLGQYFPELFSFWGLVGVILWGLSYIAMASRYRVAPEILIVFALEKFFYFGSWCWWQWNHFSELPAIWAENPTAAAFYGTYGPGDLAFGLFFLALFVQAKRGE